MARRGADIVLADIHALRLAEAEREVAALGRRVAAVHCDVSKDQDVEQLASTALAKMGHVDIVFNNAGVICRGALEDLSIADWEWQFGINVFGVVRGIKAFLPHLLQRGSGYIINTGSVAGLFALTGEGAPYIASKFAVVGLSEALALYARPRGIGVSVLCPGGVETNLNDTRRSVGMTPEREAAEFAQASTVQGNTIMTPEQIGDVVVAAVEQNRFFILAEPAHHETLVRRTADWNAFLEDRLSALDEGDVRQRLSWYGV
jgi:NAD(P)-dependent dehydrogenase (short-subunit alcohol dehydrogenase family)